MLTIKHGETMHTPETLALAKVVKEAPGSSDSARTVSMVNGIRRLATTVRSTRGTDLGKSIRMGGAVVEMPALPTGSTAVANGETGGGAVETPGIRTAAGKTYGWGDSRTILASQHEEGGVLIARDIESAGAAARRLSGLASDELLHTEATMMSDCPRTTFQGQGTVNSANALAVKGGLSDYLSNSNDDAVMAGGSAAPPANCRLRLHRRRDCHRRRHRDHRRPPRLPSPTRRPRPSAGPTPARVATNVRAAAAKGRFRLPRRRC